MKIGSLVSTVVFIALFIWLMKTGHNVLAIIMLIFAVFSLGAFAYSLNEKGSGGNANSGNPVKPGGVATALPLVDCAQGKYDMTKVRCK